MKTHRCFLLVHFCTLGVILHLVQAQNQTGFISLDCGLPKDSSYNDKTTSLSYISDANYISSGVSKNILAQYKQDWQQQFFYLRSFPDEIRNCYTLNLRKGDLYLIRANFLYGNYDGLNIMPKFDLYIGSNLWTSVTIEGATPALNFDMIHNLTSNVLQICLVKTGSTIPFISALELRPHKNTTYITESGSLEAVERLDVGSITDSSFRFSEDIYDRYWDHYNENEWTQLNTTRNINTDNGYNPPLYAMRTAATPKNQNDSMNIPLPTDDPNTLYYVYMHFAELQLLKANETREFNISYNGLPFYGPFRPIYMSTNTIFSRGPLGPKDGKYEFTISKTKNSTLPPLLNAMEVYKVHQLPRLETDQNDVNAINTIKKIYEVNKNWQGDPCGPEAFLWQGLNCSYPNSNQPRITSLNLSSSGLLKEISLSISNLTKLKILDLSNNSLSGLVPDFLSTMTSLEVINLSRNQLTGFVPFELLQRSKNNSIKLSVEGNPDLCAAVSCTKDKNNKSNVTVIASVASVSVVVVILVILSIVWIVRRRKRASKIRSASTETNQSYASNNRGFTYSNVLKITNNFERVLGKGGFGTVYHGYMDGTEVAVKMLSPSSAQGYKQFQAEVELLLRVHHRNLTSLVGYCDEGTNMGLIYEYMANGNLEEHISEKCINVLSWDSRLRIVVEAAQGLEYLHSGCKPPIVHRDVKSTNILLNKDFQAKLADFGLSRTFSVEGDTHVSTVIAGTPGHLDPEYYLTNRLTEKSDVYSIGVVLLEVITSRPVIMKIEEKTHISQWVSFMLSKGDIGNIIDPRLKGNFGTNSAWKAIEIAMACVSPYGFKRPSMNQVVMELNECLVDEIARVNGLKNEMDSEEGTEFYPLAR